jgi:short-subunit dehydrogenase
MKAAERGMIVNISSINGLAADQHAAAYSISKHALKAWNDALREELRNSGIRVTAFYPGPVNTSSWEGLPVDHQAMIQAEDIAELVVCIGRISSAALVEEVRISPLKFDPN